MRMRAAVLYEQGRSHPFTETQPLEIEDVELEGPGPGEILVKIEAAGLCHSDLSSIEGLRKRIVPTIPGHEAAGTVCELGPGVDELAEGDHVVAVFVSSCGSCRYCDDGRSNLCESSWKARTEGTLRSGARRLKGPSGSIAHYTGLSTFAEYAVMARESVVKIDPAIPFSVASLFGCAVITGVGAVINSAAVRPGQACAVVGLGGVGLNALLACVVSGAHPIVAVDMHEDKLKLALDLGATHAFNAKDSELVTQVKDTTRGGVDYAFDMAGTSAAFAAAYTLLARGGAVVTAGLPPPDETMAIPQAQFVSDGKRIIGSYMGDCVAARDIPRFIELLKAGRLPVEKWRSGQVGFDGINEGFDRLAEGRVVRLALAPHGPVD